MFHGEKWTRLGPRNWKGVDRNLLSVHPQCQFVHYKTQSCKKQFYRQGISKIIYYENLETSIEMRLIFFGSFILKEMNVHLSQAEGRKQSSGYLQWGKIHLTTHTTQERTLFFKPLCQTFFPLL